MRPVLAALLVIGSLSAAHALTGPSARGARGMVAADNAQASATGAAILAAGGDAVDAAVATALMLGVVHPFASGIGGGGFAVVHRADGTALALDFREVAPTGSTRDMYLDGKGAVIAGASTRGPKAAGVPGELAGLYALHQRYGKLPWKDVVAPAIKAARDGFPAGELLARRVRSKEKALARRPMLARQFLPDRKPVVPGQRVVRADLANTLQAVADGGADAFYKGAFAERLAALVRSDGGLITAEDLANYAVKARPLVRAEYRGHTLLSMPPPSSGGAVLVQVLRALEATDLKALGHNSSAYLHRLTEALKHAFADRARVMGDPDFTEVPTAELVGDAAVARVRAAFRAHRTRAHDVYGGQYAIPEDAGTTHFSVVDGAGNAVALTSTINTSFGSIYVPGDTGVLLNNEMDDFVAKPGVPNAFGLVGREANAIQPGKRPLSSMSPTIVLKDGEVVLALGASGGPTIITGTLQVLLNVLEFGMSPRAAVEAPRMHHQWTPDILFLEPGHPRDVVDALRARGHTLAVRPRFNAVQVIVNGPGGQRGASDPSKLGQPSGVP